MSLRDTHEAGLDVLGAGMSLGTFTPWLGMVGGALSGLAGMGGTTSTPGASASDTKAAIEKALAAERAKAAQAKAEADAKKTRTIMYVGLGVMGVAVLGTAAFLLSRKK
jgi:hypothetical protein